MQDALTAQYLSSSLGWQIVSQQGDCLMPSINGNLGTIKSKQVAQHLILVVYTCGKTKPTAIWEKTKRTPYTYAPSPNNNNKQTKTNNKINIPPKKKKQQQQQKTKNKKQTKQTTL